MHLKRWITSLIAIPALSWIIVQPSTLIFSIFIMIVSTIGIMEYYLISGISGKGAQNRTIQAYGYITGIIIVFIVHNNLRSELSYIMALNLILCGLTAIFLFKTNPEIFSTIAKQVLGIFYIPVFLSHIILIRNGQDGVPWVFFLICFVFAGDVSGFYFGKFLGKHKLCPSVSPGKTIEGAIGVIFAIFVMGISFRFLFLPQLPLLKCVLFFFFVGIIAQGGDLFESIIKRGSDIKDSGNILPGHGGILDRIDALLFVLPVAYFFKTHIF